jgi:methionine synthase II (cobalamin-independent)
MQIGHRQLARTRHVSVDVARWRLGSEELMADLARIMREEIADLAARGCTYLQMDEVPLAVICDPNNMEVVRKRGDDPDDLIDLYLEAINNSIKARPANMTVCVHMCRGNYAQGMASGIACACRRNAALPAFRPALVAALPRT